MRVGGRVAAAICVAMTVVAWTAVGRAQRSLRLNTMIELLERGKTVFGGYADSRNPDSAAGLAERSVDFVYYLMDPNPNDTIRLRTYMQFMLDPATILKKGTAAKDYPLIVMSPPYGDSTRSFVADVLDTGVLGVSIGMVETAEQTLTAIRSMRFPQASGSPDAEPHGLREMNRRTAAAARYWGVSLEEYVQKADIWPLDSRGELITMMVIQSELGVKNVREIARVKGVTTIAAGPSHLRKVYGGDDAKLEEALQRILAAAKEFNVPAVCFHCFDEYKFPSAEQRIRQGFRILVGRDESYLTHAKHAAGR